MLCVLENMEKKEMRSHREEHSCLVAKGAGVRVKGHRRLSNECHMQFPPRRLSTQPQAAMTCKLGMKRHGNAGEN